MRLGQLARKLDLRPTEIVDFLAKKNIQIENGNNTRIEESHLALILEKYAPDMKFEKEEEVAVVAPVIEEKIEPEVITQEVINEPVYVEPPASLTEEVKIEVIKAPKIELSGLKVLGKIELPETKKKENPPVEPGEPSSKDVLQEPRGRQERKPYQRREQRTSSSPSRPQKNPVALQREKEQREAEERRRAEIELNKEKRMLNYLKKLNKNQPTVKSVKNIDEPEEEKVIVTKPAPKTIFGKFLRWLNT